jgi:hypothetical protein
METVIVTATNDEYADLAIDLVRSILQRATLPPPMVCLDAGLGAENIRRLMSYGVKLVAPGWDYPGTFSGPWFRAMTARPNLPRHVPGYDLYLWLDADTWIQDWGAVTAILSAARSHDVAAISTVHRGYRQVVSVSPLEPGISQEMFYSWIIAENFDDNIASFMAERVYMNNGVVAIRGDSPIWSAWSKLAGKAFKKARHSKAAPWATSDVPQKSGLWQGGGNVALYLAQEAAFNIAFHAVGRKGAILPAPLNWLCSQALPLQSRSGNFVDTAYPYDELGIVHLSGQTKQDTWPVRGLEGAVTRRTLRFPGSEQADVHPPDTLGSR